MRFDQFFERYKAGEREEVWAEMVAVGPAVRQQPLYTEALMVAQEMMIRARQNISLLIERLHILDYQFISPQSIWYQSSPYLRNQIDQLEQQYGVLPIVLRAWYDEIGIVSFAGSHPKLNHFYRGYQIGNTEPYGDALEIEYHNDDLWSFYGQESDQGTLPPLFSFGFASDIDTKAGYSGGGDGYRIVIPAPGFDTPILYYREPHWMGTMIVPYLRTCFEWGGFPGLRHNPQAAAAAKDELAFLTKDLLPI